MIANPWIACGGPVPGGDSCDGCDDEMPPAFVVWADLSPGYCEKCSVNGGRIPQTASNGCQYYAELAPPSQGDECSVSDYLTSINFLESSIVAEFMNIADTVAYSKPKTLGFICNQAHTLSKVDGAEYDCGWPETISISPSS
jgi:hypothetical protein